MFASHPDGSDADIAALFIEVVLQRAVERLRETIPEEENITLGPSHSRKHSHTKELFSKPPSVCSVSHLPVCVFAMTQRK